MNIKICKICMQEKDSLNFSKRKTKNGTIYFRTECNDCRAKYHSNYYQNNQLSIKNNINKFRKHNKDIIKKRQRNYYMKNKLEISKKNKSYYVNNKAKITEQKQKYYLTNKDKINAHKLGYQKIREYNDPIFKLRRRVSNMVYIAIKKFGATKNNLSILNFLPYTIAELKIHLEKQFETWMSWNNWGNFNAKSWNDNDSATWTWNIDHVIPQSDLPYSSMEDENFKKCWALNNLRPYSAKQNIIDGPARSRHFKKVV